MRTGVENTVLLKEKLMGDKVPVYTHYQHPGYTNDQVLQGVD